MKTGSNNVKIMPESQYRNSRMCSKMLLTQMQIVFPTQNSPVKPDGFLLQVLATLQLVLLAASHLSIQWDLLQEKLQSYGELQRAAVTHLRLIRKVNRV
jgi:hypothetical protein